jgi:hypothetical protein
VVCDNGVTYLVTVNGNGDFTPAHDVASTSILVPTAFGAFQGTLVDADGMVIDEFTGLPSVKGSASKDRATTTSCIYTINETFDDPDLGMVTVTGTGSVTGFVTPLR